MVLARLDELGRGAWIALVVLGFWLWWPVGLAMLGYLAFGRRRRDWAGAPGQWYNAPPDGTAQTGGGVWGNFGPWGCGSRRAASPPPSGNKAFDEYRTETLRRLEEEQREFIDYLERLRQARDKSEFDAFMAERRNRQTPRPPSETA